MSRSDVIFLYFILTLGPPQVFDWQEERPGAEGQSDEGLSLFSERRRIHLDEWVTVTARRVQEVDVEPLDYDLDISREVRTSLCRQKKQIPDQP